MRRYRFHVPELFGDSVTVSGPEAGHAMTVLRLQPGDRVELFDGNGREAGGVIQSIDKRAFTVAIVSRGDSPRKSASELMLATAIPKGPRADWLVEKCAELGVSRLQPIAFARSIVEPSAVKIERWRRLTLAASKQCGSAHAMIIGESVGLTAFLESGCGSRCLYGAPQAGTPSLIERLEGLFKSDAINKSDAIDAPAVIVIGPEGGFSVGEIHALDAAGARPATWAPTVLRIETAAIAAAAVFAAVAGHRP